MINLLLQIKVKPVEMVEVAKRAAAACGGGRARVSRPWEPHALHLLLQVKPVHEVVQIAKRAAVAGGGAGGRPQVDAGAGLVDDTVNDLNAALIQARLRHVHVRRIDLVQVQVLREVLLEPWVPLLQQVHASAVDRVSTA